MILCCGLFIGIAGAQQPAQIQTGYTWDQIKTKFEAANPALKADQLNVDEMKAEEITAYLRPNPQFTLTQDGTEILCQISAICTNASTNANCD